MKYLSIKTIPESNNLSKDDSDSVGTKRYRNRKKSSCTFLHDINDVNQLEAFCDRHVKELNEAGIRRVTFLLVKSVIYLFSLILSKIVIDNFSRQLKNNTNKCVFKYLVFLLKRKSVL